VIVVGEHAGDGVLEVEAFAEDEGRHRNGFRVQGSAFRVPVLGSRRSSFFGALAPNQNAEL
jgi:hypothetical protein